MTEQRRHALTRRRVLQSACATALVGLAGCPGEAAENRPRNSSSTADGTGTPPTTTRTRSTATPPERYADRFDRVLDLAAAGADPAGDRPINDVLRERAAEDTLLVVPDGTYRLDPIELSLPTNVGLVAARGATPALRPDGLGASSEWFIFTDAEGFVLDGIDFAYREADAIGGTVVRGPGPLTIRDLRVRGAYDPGSEQLMRIDVTDPGRAALVENAVARGVDAQGVNATGFYVGRFHAGEITFRNCRLERFSDNALYASPPGGHGGEFEAAGGTVHVRGGHFRNNNIAAIRIGSDGSTVRGATVEVDRTPPHIDANSLNARGIRLRGRHDQLVENCRLAYGPDAGDASGAITMHERNGNATIRNVDIRMDRDGVNAILAKEPLVEGDATPTVENVTVRGSAAGGQTVSVVGRAGARFRNCCLQQSGEDRDGIVLVDAADCSIEDSEIDVAGDPVVLQNASLAAEYTPSDACTEATDTAEPSQERDS